MDNSEKCPKDYSIDSVVNTAFGIRIQINPNENYIYVQNTKKSFSLISKAYATKPVYSPYYLPNQEIKEIKIYSFIDSVENASTKPNISNDFLARGAFEDCLFPYQKLDVFIKNYNSNVDNKIFDKYNLHSEISFFYIDLFLMKAPELNTFYQFVVYLELTNDSCYSDTTSRIYLYSVN